MLQDWNEDKETFKLSGFKAIYEEHVTLPNIPDCLPESELFLLQHAPIFYSNDKSVHRRKDVDRMCGLFVIAHHSRLGRRKRPSHHINSA